MVTNISQEPYAVTIYKLGDTYYGARSNEFGYANYEIIPSPQFVLNPLTAMLNPFSIELGLNEQQKQQILPFLQDEAKQLGALKKNTSLKPLEKLEQLKQIATKSMPRSRLSWISSNSRSSRPSAKSIGGS